MLLCGTERGSALQGALEGDVLLPAFCLPLSWQPSPVAFLNVQGSSWSPRADPPQDGAAEAVSFSTKQGYFSFLLRHQWVLSATTGNKGVPSLRWGDHLFVRSPQVGICDGSGKLLFS